MFLVYRGTLVIEDLRGNKSGEYVLFTFPPLFVQWGKNRLCVLDRHYAGTA